MKNKLLVSLLAFSVFGCSAGRVNVIKQHANETWQSNGFDVIGYQGYQWGTFETWGGCVWYTVQRNQTTYEGCITKWGDEYHIYNLKALDAIKGD